MYYIYICSYSQNKKVMFNNLPLYKIIPLPNDNIEIALVDEPAIEEYFHFFSKESEIITFNSDKMIIEGIVS